MTSNLLPAGQFTFRVIEDLGAGGLGRVDKIEITASNAVGKPVGSEWARKRLNQNWAAHPTMVERFEREIAALKRMSHPHIVGFEGENLKGEPRFYLMPVFLSSVRKFVSAGGWRGNWRSIARVGAQMADALQYAHAKGYIHRDLKPDNVLFNTDGPLVIADWGLGYFVHKESKVLQPLTVGGMGTEYYCSVEQWASGKCDHRGDIYSLGMMLDEWVTGERKAITFPGAGISWTTATGVGKGVEAFNAALRSMTAALSTNRIDSMTKVAAVLNAAASMA